jgi:hypothetical protein
VMQNVSITRAARPFELRNVQLQRCGVAVNSGFQTDEAVDVTDGCDNAGYSLSLCSDSESVEQGGATTFELTVTPNGGFQDPVSFRVSGLPGMSSSFEPPVVQDFGATTLTVVTNNLTPTGTFPLTLTATSGDTGRFNRIAVATLVVLEASPNKAKLGDRRR